MKNKNICQRVFTTILFVVFVLLIVAKTLPGLAHSQGVELSGTGTAIIDGVMSPGEWMNADSIEVPVNIPEGGTTSGTLFVMNDESNLYLAVKFYRETLDPGNTASFAFDNNHDGGVTEDGDDRLLINPRPTVGFRDLVAWSRPPCPAGSMCGIYDTEVGGTNDGEGAFSYNGEYTLYEFSHPLDSEDDDHDFSLSKGDTVGFCLSIRMISYDSILADTYFPCITPSAPWDYGDILIARILFEPIDIDIKPGSYPNSINLKSKGKVPVAILTTDDFDAYDVDPVTCEFAGAYPLRWKMEDVDNDGDHDMLFHFMTQEINLTEDSTEATIECETFEGMQITGTDSVNIVPKCKGHDKKVKKFAKKAKKYEKKGKKGK